MQSALLHPRVVLFASDSLCNLSALRHALGFLLLIFCAGKHKVKPCEGMTCSCRYRNTYLTTTVKTFFSSILQLFRFEYSYCVKLNGICRNYNVCSMCIDSLFEVYVWSPVPSHMDVFVSSFVASQFWLVDQRFVGNESHFIATQCYSIRSNTPVCVLFIDSEE